MTHGQKLVAALALLAAFLGLILFAGFFALFMISRPRSAISRSHLPQRFISWMHRATFMFAHSFITSWPQK